MERALLALGVAVSILVVVGLSLHARLLKVLRERYSTVWRELGSPSMVWNNTISNGWETQKFIFSRKSNSLNDPQVSRLVGAMRVTSILVAVLLAAYIWIFVSAMPPSITPIPARGSYSMNVIIALWFALFGLLVAVSVVGERLGRRILALLRSRHHETWLELGSPRPFFNYSIRKSWEMWRFMRSERYKALEDPELSRLFKYAKALNLIVAVIMATCLAGFVYLWILVRS